MAVQEHGWQWQKGPSENPPRPQQILDPEPNVWDCQTYCRASSRLSSARAGLDAIAIPEQACCNTSCLKFASCLPLYGCFIARLQTKVRSLYGIRGSKLSDLFDGCCHPFNAVVRNEQEIVLRERHRRFHAKKEEAQYKAEALMTYVNAGIREESVAAPRSQGSDIETTEAAPHGLSHDSWAPAHGSDHPPVHHQKQDYNIVLADRPTVTESTRNQTHTSTDRTNRYMEHPLSDHPMIVMTGSPRYSTHRLEDDPSISSQRGSIKGHSLEHDSRAPTPSRTPVGIPTIEISHHRDNTPSPCPTRGTTPRPLSKLAAGIPHTLDADERFSSTPVFKTADAIRSNDTFTSSKHRVSTEGEVFSDAESSRHHDSADM